MCPAKSKCKPPHCNFRVSLFGLYLGLDLSLIAEYPATDLHKNSVYCILTRSSKNAAKFKQ